jgi:hypothetical protein
MQKLSSARQLRQAVDLCCHDEAVLVEALYLLRAQRHGHITPATTNFRVMAFELGEFANLLDNTKGWRLSGTSIFCDYLDGHRSWASTGDGARVKTLLALWRRAVAVLE